MSGYSYLKCWTIYRKNNQLPFLQPVVGHKPNNRYQLTFDLQIAVQMALLTYLKPQNFNHSLATKAILEYTLQRNIKEVLNIEYINTLTRICQDCGKEGPTLWERKTWDLLLGVLIQATEIGRYQTKQESLNYLRFLGQTVLVINSNSKMEGNDCLQSIREWWSYRQWKSILADSTIELMILWILRHQSSQIIDENAHQIRLFPIWLQQVKILLDQAQKINHQILSLVVTEAKKVAKLFVQKDVKSSREMLMSLKNEFFAQKQRVQVFATIFAVLQALAKEMDFILFDCQDLLLNQYLYGYLYYLQQANMLYHFIAFHSFMRQHSVMEVLVLNRSLTNFMNQKKLPGIDRALEDKDIHIMSEFNQRPITTARAVLNHFLHLSGIFISQTIKNVKQRPTIKQLKITFPDPLQFLLIKKEHWEDKFGYQVIGMSMWIICDGYCREVKLKAKDIPQKQINEYIKKLKIGLCLFLLGLKYPTKMLQFMPFQGDIAWDFALTPVLPGMLMDSRYFFSSFNRDKLSFQTRVDFGAEGDIMPWATTITAHKHIPFILHNHRGYQFFEAVLSNVNHNNLKGYAEVILNSLSIALRNMGLSLEVPEVDQRKARARLSGQIRGQLLRLLQRLASVGEKLGEKAVQLRGLLVDQ